MNKLLKSLIVVSIFLLTALSVGAVSGIEYQSSLLWSGSEDIWVDLNDAYCVLANGLEVYDISNRAVPIKIGELYIPGENQAMCKVGRYIYVASGESGLAVIDAQNPRSLSLVKFIQTPGETRGVFFHASRNQLYLADYENHNNSGVLIYDLLDLANPTPANSYIANSMQSVYAVDSLAYLITTGGNLSIVNVDSDSLLYRFTRPSAYARYKAVYSRDSIAFISWYHAGSTRDGFLETWNVADAASPVKLDSVSVGERVLSDIFVRGDIAYVNGNNLAVVNVSNPTQLAVLGKLSKIGHLSGAFLQGNLVFGVPEYKGGIAVIDVTNSATPTLINAFDKIGSVEGVCEQNGYLYVATSRNGLQIYNVYDPKAPVLAGLFEPINQSGNIGILHDVYVNGNLALAVGGNEAFILDVSNPAAPDSLGTTGYINTVNAMQIVDTLAYLATSGGVVIVDISDPANPNILITYYPGGVSVSDIHVRNDILYLANDDGFLIVNVSDPFNIVELGSFLTDEYAEHIAVRDNLAFVTISDFSPPTVYIFDISDPANPDTIATTTFHGTSYDLTVQDSMLYIYGSGTPSLEIINIKNPLSPFLADSYETPGSGGMSVSGEMVYLADGYSAMILKTPYGSVTTSVSEDDSKAQPSRINLSQNYPNPFNPSTVIDFNVPKLSQVTIELFNATGQKVRTLLDETRAAGSYQVSWDGTDGNGSKVATGMYFYRLTVGENSVTKKMVLLK